MSSNCTDEFIQILVNQTVCVFVCVCARKSARAHTWACEML